MERNYTYRPAAEAPRTERNGVIKTTYNLFKQYQRYRDEKFLSRLDHKAEIRTRERAKSIAAWEDPNYVCPGDQEI